MVNRKVQDVAVLNDKFEPRYPIELGKAGEFAGRGYFSGSPGRRHWSATRIRTLRHGWRYTVQCPYCNREFRRMRRDASLKPHKDPYGNACYGRVGSIIGQEFV